MRAPASLAPTPTLAIAQLEMRRAGNDFQLKMIFNFSQHEAHKEGVYFSKSTSLREKFVASMPQTGFSSKSTEFGQMASRALLALTTVLAIAAPAPSSCFAPSSLLPTNLAPSARSCEWSGHQTTGFSTRPVLRSPPQPRRGMQLVAKMSAESIATPESVGMMMQVTAKPRLVALTVGVIPFSELGEGRGSMSGVGSRSHSHVHVFMDDVRWVPGLGE